MTPYKIITLFNIHKIFNPDKFAPPKPEGMDDIDIALGGL